MSGRSFSCGMKVARVSGMAEMVKHMKPSLLVDLLDGSYASVPYDKEMISVNSLIEVLYNLWCGCSLGLRLVDSVVSEFSELWTLLSSLCCVRTQILNVVRILLADSYPTCHRIHDGLNLGKAHSLECIRQLAWAGTVPCMSGVLNKVQSSI